jgi:hypothetical protein
MSIKQSQYEALLAEYSDHQGAIALLRQYRSYLEMIPSMRRPTESLITIPLPLIRVRSVSPTSDSGSVPTRTTDTAMLPCDVGIIMCDPEWKIKTGGEIFVFIHRPQEDFSDLLSRWRHTQMLLYRDYEWVMPHRYKHILNEAADDTYPLFVTFQNTPDRIRRGLRGAGLPYLVQHVDAVEELDIGERQKTSAIQDIEEIFSDFDDGV